MQFQDYGAVNQHYVIKVVPERGGVVHRLDLTRRHIVGALAIVAAMVFGALAVASVQTWRAHAQAAALQSMAKSQRGQMRALNEKAASLRAELRSIQRQNSEIQQLIGVGRPVRKTSQVRRGFDALVVATAQTAHQSNVLRRLTMHVLNVRRIQELARARVLAAIPSIDPVDGAPIVGCFCYRSAPDSEFHPGVDLGANYGDPVHAAAAGEVASADWDGGFGLKVDIDHGNGYHTWYAHLSKAEVHAGEFVHKGEEIGLVGSTGYSTGPHLHYQVMLHGTAINPAPYLDGVPSKVLASLP